MRKVKNSIIKKEKGAIAIFVLVALLFMSAFLILLFANNINKSKDTQEQFKITGEIYAGEGEQGAYDQAFGELRKKNRQLLTATSQENSNTLELQNVFAEEKLSNYKIYGNSVQNETPSPTNPVEIQSVGDKTKNLFDIDSAVNENLVKNDDGTYTIWKNTEYTTGRFSKTISVNIPANTKFTLSCDVIGYNGQYALPFQICCIVGRKGRIYKFNRKSKK